MTRGCIYCWESLSINEAVGYGWGYRNSEDERALKVGLNRGLRNKGHAGVKLGFTRWTNKKGLKRFNPLK